MASSASITCVTNLSTDGSITSAVPLRKTGIIETKSDKFIGRWLDATKSTLLFAKGVILVEGIAEAFLMPELANTVLATYNSECKELVAKKPPTLAEAGVSVINMNGIYFKHFMQLFCDVYPAKTTSLSIPIRCSGITDHDPAKTEKIGEKRRTNKTTSRQPLPR